GAAQVMFNQQKNYRLRPGARWGLEAIGMLSQGIIWNQDLHKFKQNRPMFNKALSSAALAKAHELAQGLAKKWCLSMSHEWQVDQHTSWTRTRAGEAARRQRTA
ncbi:unnamed protein product, partial [Effrenium voratum]